jgi:hypothetical protein
MAALIKSIKMNKKYIFGGSLPTRGMGPIHALCLQLVVNGIIHEERVNPKACHCEVGNS